MKSQAAKSLFFRSWVFALFILTVTFSFTTTASGNAAYIGYDQSILRDVSIPDLNAPVYVIYFPLIANGSGASAVEMTGLHITRLPQGWISSPLEGQAQTGIADSEMLRLTSADGLSTIEIRVDWHVLPPERVFGSLAMYPETDYQESVVSYFGNVPIQVMEYQGSQQGKVLAFYAAFKAGQASYSVSLLAPKSAAPAENFYTLLESLEPLPELLPPSSLASGGQPNLLTISTPTHASLPDAIPYDRNAVRSYAYTYGSINSNGDGCYLWQNGSGVYCYYVTGAWGVDAIHYIRHAINAGGLAISDIPAQEARNAGPQRDYLLTHGGVEKSSASELMIGDVVYVGRNGCWGWGGVVHDVDGSGPLVSTHSANHMNLRPSQMTSTSCGATNMWSYIHIVATQDQPAPLLSQSLTLNPSTPFVGQAVQATFQVCNYSQWGIFDTNNLYVYSSSGLNFSSVDIPPLGTGNPGGCYSYNTTSTPFASPGWYVVRAGYDNGGGFTILGVTSGKTNERSVYVASLDEIQIQGEMVLTPELIPQGNAANIQFQARNIGTQPLVDNFRVRLYNDTYPAPGSFVAEFAASGEITLAAGNSYTYNATQILNTPGIYWIIGEHYSNGQWRPVVGNSQRSIRVTYPMPSPPRLAKGMPPYISFAGEPVNTATGNFFHEHTDIQSPQPGMNFEFTRYYNHIDANKGGPLGHGWRWSLAFKVDWQADKTAIVYYPDGHEAYFFGQVNPSNPFDLSGDYAGQLADTSMLTRNADGTGQLISAEQITYQFNAQGLLSQVRNAQNNGFDIHRDASGYVLDVTSTSGDSYAFSYTNGYLTAIVLPDGQSLHYTYSVSGDLIHSQSPEGGTLTYGYDSQHRMTEIYDSRGNRTLLNEYDNQNRVFRQTDAEGQQTDFTYNSTTQTVFVDALGNPITYTYNTNQQVTRIEDVAGQVTSFAYDVDFNRTQHIDPEGGIWRWAYDAQGRVISSTNPLGETWTYQRDIQGNLIKKSGPLPGQVTQYAYDANNTLIYIKDAEGCETFRQYNAQGLLVQETEPGGMVTGYRYNDAGLQTYIIEYVDADTVLTTTMTYDERGNRLSVTDAAGHTTISTYDTNNHVISAIGPTGRMIVFTYDANGNLTSETDGSGNTRYYTYDSRDRMSSYTDFAGHVWLLEYDVIGHVTKKTDPHGNYVAYTYDEAGNQITYRDPMGKIWQYAYDKNGNRIRETDPLGNQILYTYDLAERLISTNRPCEACPGGRAIETRAYYADGALKSVADGRGATTTYYYDKIGRRTKIVDAQGNETVFRYNAHGDLIETVDPLGHSIVSTYNKLGWLLTQTDRLGRVTIFEYDAVGNQTKVIDPRNFATQYFYNAAGRPVRVANALGYETLFEYDIRGNLVETTNALLGVSTFSYDANNHLLQTTNPRGFSTFYTYNELGQHTQMRNALDDVTGYEYDAAGRLVSETNPAGFTRTWQYDEIGRLTGSTDWNGTLTTIVYNADGSRVRITNPLGGQTYRVFDANGNRIAETNPIGAVTFFTFDSLNRLTQTQDALNNLWQYQYDALGRQTQVTAPNLAVTQYLYDKEGQVLEITDALGNATLYTYDLSGNLVQQTDRNGHSTYYEYDALNRAIRRANPLGFDSHIIYNPLGKPVQTTDFNGNITIYEYDANQNLARLVNALNGTTVFHYDALDRNTEIIDPNLHLTQMTYDAVGNLTQVQLPEGQVSSYTYDGMGNRLTSTNADGHTTMYSYNGLGQTVQIADPLSHTTSYGYNPAGQLNQTIDANGNQVRYSYDALGRLIAVTDPLGYVTRYRYDTVSNLVGEADANLNITTYTYDLLGRLIAEANPLNQSWQYLYDAEGNLIRRTDANGQITTYAYNDANQLTNIHYPTAAQDVQYTYDPNGNLLQFTDALGTTHFEYDALNRMKCQVDPWGSIFQYTFDPAGNQTGISYPDNSQVSYQYDANNWLTQMADPFGGVTTYQYNPNGLLTRTDYPNQTWTGYTYDDAGRLTHLINGVNGQTDPLASFTYTLDAVGNRTQTAEHYTQNGQPIMINRLYRYNPRSELLQEIEVRGGLAGIGVTTSYTYDPVGNRLSMTSDRGTAGQPVRTNYIYDQDNRLLQAGIYAYTYDANGNRLTRQSPGQTEQYQYDYENRLESYERSVNGSIQAHLENQYDGLGRRLVKNSQDAAGNTDWRRYAVLGQSYQQAAEWSSDDSVQLYRGLGEQLVSLTETPNGQPTQRYWFSADGLGSVAAATDVNGQDTLLNSYDAFGQRLNLDGSLVAISSPDTRSRYSYSGKEQDTESGLYYFGARFYDSQAGVWISTDPARGQPIDPTSRHGYLYARNNPVNRVDPDGRFDYRTGAVQWGDTWESIATQWNTSVSELRHLNPWVSTPQVGDYLQLPDCRSAECQLQMGIREVRIAGMSGTECTQRIRQRQEEYRRWVERQKYLAWLAQQDDQLEDTDETTTTSKKNQIHNKTVDDLIRERLNTFPQRWVENLKDEVSDLISPWTAIGAADPIFRSIYGASKVTKYTSFMGTPIIYKLGTQGARKVANAVPDYGAMSFVSIALKETEYFMDISNNPEKAPKTYSRLGYDVITNAISAHVSNLIGDAAGTWAARYGASGGAALGGAVCGPGAPACATVGGGIGLVVSYGFANMAASTVSEVLIDTTAKTIGDTLDPAFEWSDKNIVIPAYNWINENVLTPTSKKSGEWF